MVYIQLFGQLIHRNVQLRLFLSFTVMGFLDHRKFLLHVFFFFKYGFSKSNFIRISHLSGLFWGSYLRSPNLYGNEAKVQQVQHFKGNPICEHPNFLFTVITKCQKAAIFTVYQVFALSLQVLGHLCEKVPQVYKPSARKKKVS